MTHPHGFPMADGARADGAPRRGRAPRRLTALALLCTALAAGPLVAHAADAAAKARARAASEGVPFDPNDPADTKPPVVNSDMDANLMYRLLLGEFARQENAPNEAIQVYVDTAKAQKSDQLFRRAVEIALENGNADQALDIVKTWRKTLPKSVPATHAHVQLLFALDRVPEAAEPLRALLAMTSGTERAALIAGLPRAAQRAKDKSAVRAQVEQILAPYKDVDDSAVAVRVALGRMRLAEGNPAAALDLAREANARDPAAIGPALLALDLMTQPGAEPYTGQAGDPSAEAIVRRYLDTPKPEPVIHQALAALLTQQQRIAEAAVQVRLAAEARPNQTILWLSLGELEIELRHADAADAALKKALDLALAADAAEEAAAATDTEDAADASDDEDATPPAEAPPTRVRTSRIYLMLARSAQLRHDDATSRMWLDKIPASESDLPVLSLRAELLARSGKLTEARALIQSAPAEGDEQRRLKVLTEVQLLRDSKQLAEAQRVLAQANAATPDDVDLLYEQAMIDERLDNLEEMERLLRKVIELQPDHAQAMNALGYSLADRRMRLDEALQLVTRAHELAPGDPFIVDSLGWIEFRMGNLPEATRWLRQAYTARNDTEIAAHLGEALWAQGQRAEALQIFQEAHRRDADNEVLRETMNRLKAQP
jgi:tetratricopeptide (TPR) repeat protein